MLRTIITKIYGERKTSIRFHHIVKLKDKVGVPSLWSKEPEAERGGTALCSASGHPGTARTVIHFFEIELQLVSSLVRLVTALYTVQLSLSCVLGVAAGGALSALLRSRPRSKPVHLDA